MNILIPDAYFKPESIAYTHLEDDLLGALIAEGHTISIVCPVPTRGLDSTTIQQYKRIKQEKLANGRIRVTRFWAPQEGNQVVARAFRYFWCNLRTYLIGKKIENIDLVFAVSTPPTQGLLASRLGKKLQCPVVYSLQDIFPDSLVHTGMTHKGSLLWKIGRWVENVTYRAVDKIIVISEGFKQNILAKGVPEEKIAVIPNWVDENHVVNIDRADNVLFDKYGLDRDKFYICYSGNIGHTQNMEMLTETVKLLEDHKNIGFVIIGDGAFRPKLEEIIAQKGLKNITLLPFQDYADISQVFSLGDVGLIISKKGVGTNSVPSKTWSIMSAERPVLASFDEDSEICRIITETGCGICVPPDDAGAMKDAILQLFENREANTQMGKKGREYILKNLTKSIGTQKYVDVLRGVMEKNN